MLEYDFTASVGYWTTMASHAFQRALNDEVRPHGITSRQCQVLGLLALAGPLPQNELAERIGIEPPTLVGILDRMERDGWIRRDLCVADRRKKIVSPTQAAEPVWEKIIECAKRVRTQATQSLTSREIEELMRMLNVIQQNLAAKTPAEVV